MAEKSIIISAEEEAILLKPIDEYVGKIQEQIDALRVEGSDKVNSLKNQIAIAKENKNLTKEEQNKIIGECKKNLEKAKATEDANKQQIAKLIADAESFLSKHYNSEYYNIVAKSCEAEKKAENSNFEKLKADLQEEHKKAVSSLKDAEEIKAEKYTYKNKLYDAQMTHESRIQEIKDRKHDAYMHKFHLIDLLRMSKYTFAQKQAQNFENYKYTFNMTQFLYKNGLYIVIIMIFIALCIITPFVKNTQLFTTTNILNILQQASPRMFLALGVAGLILLTGTDLSVGRMVGMGMVTATIIMHNGINTGGVFGHIFDFSNMGTIPKALLALGVCIILTTVFAMIAGFFMARFKMQSPKEAVELTSVYVRICGGGIFFIVAYNLLSAIFRGLGDSKSPLLFVFVACIVNVIGDIVLVAGFHMDAAGAAIATVTAQALSVVFAIVILIKKELPFKITRKDFGLNSQCKKFLKIGLPLALQEFLTQMSFLALCAFVNRLGLEASSGYGVACKIVNFAMLVPSALMQSMASFVSQNIGAGKAKRAKKSMFTGIGVGLVVGCIVFLLVMFGGDILAGFFTTDVAVIQKGYAYLKGFALETIVTAILFSMVGYFNGNNKTVWVMTQGLIQTLLVRLPFAYVMSIQPNASLTKIGLAAPVSTMVGIVLNVGFYIYLDRAEKKSNAL